MLLRDDCCSFFFHFSNPFHDPIVDFTTFKAWDLTFWYLLTLFGLVESRMEYPHEDLGGNNDFIRRSSQEDSQHNHNQQHQQYQDQSFDINININPLISNYQSQSPSPLNYHQGQFQSYNYNQIATPTASSSYQQPAPSPSGLPSYLSSRSSFDYSQQIDPSNYPNPYPIHSRTPSYSTDNSSSHSINNNINMPPANASNQVEKNHPCPNCGKAFARGENQREIVATSSIPLLPSDLFLHPLPSPSHPFLRGSSQATHG